jgi:hypothetical protein
MCVAVEPIPSPIERWALLFTRLILARVTTLPMVRGGCDIHRFVRAAFMTLYSFSRSSWNTCSWGEKPVLGEAGHHERSPSPVDRHAPGKTKLAGEEKPSG